MENRNKTEWLVKVGNDDAMWAPIDSGIGKCIPDYIVNQYNNLRTLAKEGNVYGLMIQIKDVYETIIKISCVIALSAMNVEGVNNNKKLRDIYSAILDNPLSMGSWNALAGKLTKSGLIDDNTILTLLSKTKELFTKKKVGNKKTADVVNWRNDRIGHGFIMSEDDEDLSSECIDLIKYIKDFLVDNEILNAYREISFNVKENDEEELEDVDFIVAGNQYLASRYACAELAQCYFFDSYYRRKKWAKFVSYDTGKPLINDEKLQKYFNNLYKEYANSKLSFSDSVKGEIQNTARDQAMRYLVDDDNYIKPQYLVNKINSVLNENESGIILIEMERGMGKTAFTLHADTEYEGGSLFKDSIVRTYNLGDAHMRGMSNFIANINRKLHYAPKNISDDVLERETGISINDSDEKKSENLALLLNGYCDLCEGLCMPSGDTPERIILILDGVDELTEETEEILKYIPDGKSLETGVFIILTSRCKDENDLSVRSSGYIEKCEEKANEIITVKRDDVDYLETLNKFIHKIIPNLSDDDYKLIVRKSEGRFLKCKLFKLSPKELIAENSEADIFEIYMEQILTVRNNFSKNELLNFLSALTVMREISLEDYTQYLNISEITFSLIGCINDVLPMLVVERREGGNYYRWGSVEYREKFIEKYGDQFCLFIEISKNAFLHWEKLVMIEFVEKCRNAETQNSTDAQEEFDDSESVADYDSVFFYMSFINEFHNVIKEKSIYKIFFAGNFYLKILDLESIVGHRLFFDKTLSNKQEVIRDEFRKVIRKSLSWLLENYSVFVVENINAIIRNIDRTSFCIDEKIGKISFEKFLESHNVEWIKLFETYISSSISSSSLNSQEVEDIVVSYLKTITDPTDISLCLEYKLATIKASLVDIDSIINARMYETHELWLSAFDKCEFGRERDNNKQIEKRQIESLLSVQIYWRLAEAITSGTDSNNNHYARAYEYYKKVKKDGYDFIYLEDVCEELNREHIVEYLVEDFWANEITRKIEKSIYDFANCEKYGELDFLFDILKNDEYKKYHGKIKDIIRDNFDEIIRFDYDENDFTQSFKIPEIMAYIYTSEEMNERKLELIDVILDRGKWHSNNNVATDLANLFKTIIFDKTIKFELREKYTRILLEKVEPVNFLYRKLFFYICGSDDLYLEEGRICSDITLWLFDRYYCSNNTDYGYAKASIAEMSNTFKKVYERYNDKLGFTPDTFNEWIALVFARVKMNALLRLRKLEDDNDEVMSYINEIRDYYLEGVKSKDSSIEFIKKMEKVSYLFYAMEEYESGKTFLEQILEEIKKVWKKDSDEYNYFNNRVNFLNIIFDYFLNNIPMEEVMKLEKDGSMIYDPDWIDPEDENMMILWDNMKASFDSGENKNHSYIYNIQFYNEN